MNVFFVKFTGVPSWLGRLVRHRVSAQVGGLVVLVENGKVWEII